MTSAPQPELFVDGLLDVSFSRGIVRVDLYSFSAKDKANSGQPLPEHRQRLVMSAQSFVEFVGSLQMAAHSLRDKGVLDMPRQDQPAQPQAPAQQAPVAQTATAQTAEAEAPAAETQAATPEPSPAETSADVGSIGGTTTEPEASQKRMPSSPNFGGSSTSAKR